MNRVIHCVRVSTLCLLSVFASLSPANNVFAAESEAAKRVLIISTGSRFSIGFPIVEQNAVDRLRELYRGRLEIYAESLDIIRFRSESYQRVFHDYLRDKYVSDPPDVIVLIYVGNLGVLENHLEQIFPTTPVVAVGLTEEAFPAAAFGARATGVAQRSDPGGTMELMRRLQPDLQRVVLIGGTASVDRETMNRVREAARAYSDRIEFLVWDNRSIDDILKAVTSLPPQTAVLFIRMFRDGAGRATISARAARSIATVSNAPVYVMSDPMLGTGAVGGSVVDTVYLGKRAGELANRLLIGAEPRSLPSEIINKGVPIFDWRALQRWGIKENRLPKNSIVRFRPVSMWEDYKLIIIGVVLLIILQAALIYVLLHEKRRRILAQQGLEERLRFEQLVAELSRTFINLPAEKIEAQLVEALGRVGILLGFEVAALSVFTGPGFTGRVAYLWRAEGVSEIPSNLTDQDFPWSAKELFEGRDVSLYTMKDFPPEAQIDRATYERFHIRSTYSVPMVAGRSVIGVLGLCAVWKERKISRGLVDSQRLLGEVFANALMRKKVEEARQESEYRFRMMADAAPVMIWMSGTNKLREYFNKQWLDFTGRTLEQEVGDGWAEGVHHDDRGRVLEIYGKSFEGQQEFALEYRLRRRDGQYGWVLEQGVPRFDAVGNFLGSIGSCIDVTERKQADLELRQQRQELAHMSRVSTMGELAASLAHELNQPLTAILSNAQAGQRFLEAESPDLGEVGEILKDIEQDDKRASGVIHRMRALARKEELDMAPLDLGAVIRDVLLLIHSDAVLHNIRVSLQVPGNLPPVRGDKVQLQQVIINLLLNAFDAMKDCLADGHEVVVRAEQQDAHLLRVAVRDLGTGISIDNLQRLFQPFYTTKRDGLGIGLAISRSIIEAHGGRLWAENNPDRGATFYFTVPMDGGRGE